MDFVDVLRLSLRFGTIEWKGNQPDAAAVRQTNAYGTNTGGISNMDNPARTCAYCGNETTPDETAATPDGKPCCADCAARIRLEELLETDPELRGLNDRYIRQGVLRLIFGVLSLALLALMKAVLDNGWADALGIFCMLSVPITLTVFLIACIRRGMLRKKIQRTLHALTQTAPQ